MLSNQILHKTAQDIREITGFDCAIWDMQGLCLVRTNENLTEYELQIQDFRDDEEEPDEMILDEMGMFRIYEDSDPTYILMLKEMQMVWNWRGAWEQASLGIFFMHTKNGWIRTGSFRICFWITCFWSISIIRQRR